MRAAAAAVVAVVAACTGGGDDDVAYEVPADPFAGMYDSPDDFSRAGCRPGSIGAALPMAGVYSRHGFRLAIEDGGQAVYTVSWPEEARTAHTATADDLMFRRASYAASAGWQVASYDVCDVLADGTLRGHYASCRESPMLGPRCVESVLEVAPLRRAPGEPDANGLTKIGELPLEYEATNVRVDGGVAYLPMGAGGMRIVSVANPEIPTALGWWLPAEGNYYNDVKLMTVGGRRYAVLAGFPSDVVDVTDPTAPFLAAHLETGAHTLFVEGTLVYSVGGASGLDLTDLSTPTAPRHRASVVDLGVRRPHDLHVVGGIAYVSVPSVGLALIDCRDPSAPFVTAVANQDDTRYWHSPWRTTFGGRTLVVHGDEGPDGKLAVVDVDPASPTYTLELGAWSPRPEVSLHNVMALADRAYLAHYQDGVRILDLSTPSPTPIAHYNTWRESDASASFFSGAFGLDLDAASRRIYVADSQRGLIILEGAADLFPR